MTTLFCQMSEGWLIWATKKIILSLLWQKYSLILERFRGKYIRRKLMKVSKLWTIFWLIVKVVGNCQMRVSKECRGKILLNTPLTRCQSYVNGFKNHLFIQKFHRIWFLWKKGLWKAWILWKMRLWKYEFCEKWDFENVNFVKNEILKTWILRKMRLKFWIL